MLKTVGHLYSHVTRRFVNLAGQYGNNHILRHLVYKEQLKRGNRFTVMLNDREMRALDIYCSRYRIRNRSEFFRETIMKAILKRFDDEHPTLWEEPEPTLFNREGSG
jgi:hypothetical protein